MAHRWDLRAPEPRELFRPVRIDPTGASGPTRAQARGRQWRPVGKGLHVPADVARTRVEQRILEEFARLPAGSLVSGWAALRMHGVNFCDGLDETMAEVPVPVVLPLGKSFRADGVEPHREAVPDDERTIRHGVRCTTPHRALFDAMKWSGDVRKAVQHGDMAFAARVVRREHFLGYSERRRGDKGSVVVVAALALTVDRSKSPQETRMRLTWVLDAGLPAPRCNWPVHDADGRRVGRPDLLIEDLAVAGEFDGADHRGIVRQADDVAKESDYRDLGLECFRVVGRDLLDTELVVRRMQAAVRRAEEAARPRRWSIPDHPGRL